MSQITPAELLAQGISPRFNYDDLIAQIVAAHGVYVAIPLADIRGSHVAAKQTSLTQAAKVRGWRITTTTRCPGFIYAKLVVNQ
jgi:hypothetical protein